MCSSIVRFWLSTTQLAHHLSLESSHIYIPSNGNCVQSGPGCGGDCQLGFCFHAAELEVPSASNVDPIDSARAEAS